MPPKRAAFLTWGEDEQVNEVRKFLERAGVLLDMRDLEKQPLTEDEVRRLVGFIPIEHFLNPNSKSYEKHHLERDSLDRNEVVGLIAKDMTLLRRPIIRTNRLFTIGCDRKKICEMLQISQNGKSGQEEDKENGQPHQPAPANK